MKVQFEFAPIPQPQSKETKLRYYPRVANRHLVKTREISAEIQHACSLTEIDVNAVLDALSRSLSNYLRQGNRVSSTRNRLLRRDADLPRNPRP